MAWLLCSIAAQAQHIPLGQQVEVTITSRDSTLLGYYNIYAFDYVAPGGAHVATGEILVPKHQDHLPQQRMAKVTITLCRITGYINSTRGVPVRPMPVEDHIQITPKGQPPIYLNFDPGLPDPVLEMCPEKP